MPNRSLSRVLSHILSPMQAQCHRLVGSQPGAAVLLVAQMLYLLEGASLSYMQSTVSRADWQSSRIAANTYFKDRVYGVHTSSLRTRRGGVEVLQCVSHELHEPDAQTVVLLQSSRCQAAGCKPEHMRHHGTHLISAQSAFRTLAHDELHDTVSIIIIVNNSY